MFVGSPNVHSNSIALQKCGYTEYTTGRSPWIPHTTHIAHVVHTTLPGVGPGVTGTGGVCNVTATNANKSTTQYCTVLTNRRDRGPHLTATDCYAVIMALQRRRQDRSVICCWHHLSIWHRRQRLRPHPCMSAASFIFNTTRISIATSLYY